MRRETEELNSTVSVQGERVGVYFLLHLCVSLIIQSSLWAHSHTCPCERGFSHIQMCRLSTPPPQFTQTPAMMLLSALWWCYREAVTWIWHGSSITIHQEWSWTEGLGFGKDRCSEPREIGSRRIFGRWSEGSVVNRVRCTEGDKWRGRSHLLKRLIWDISTVRWQKNPLAWRQEIKRKGLFPEPATCSKIQLREKLKPRPIIYNLYL